TPERDRPGSLQRLWTGSRGGDARLPVVLWVRYHSGRAARDAFLRPDATGTGTMLIGYVSDERYCVLNERQLEFRNEAGSWEARSRATGSVHLELPPGRYTVTLAKAGYGFKRVELDVFPGMPPYQFRMLKDGLLGYAWPKWVKAGEKAEFRVHS